MTRTKQFRQTHELILKTVNLDRLRKLNIRVQLFAQKSSEILKNVVYRFTAMQGKTAKRMKV